MGEIFKLIITFLPILLELFNKSTEERKAAQTAHDAAVRAAVKAEDWLGILITGVAARINRMDDDRLAALAGYVEEFSQAATEFAAAQAVKGGGR